MATALSVDLNSGQTVEDLGFINVEDVVNLAGAAPDGSYGLSWTDNNDFALAEHPIEMQGERDLCLRFVWTPQVSTDWKIVELFASISIFRVKWQLYTDSIDDSLIVYNHNTGQPLWQSDPAAFIIGTPLHFQIHVQASTWDTDSGQWLEDGQTQLWYGPNWDSLALQADIRNVEIQSLTPSDAGYPSAWDSMAFGPMGVISAPSSGLITIPTGECAIPPAPTPTERTIPIVRERVTPILSVENKLITVPYIELDIQPGVGTSTGSDTDPVLMVQASRDGGFTWDNERWISMGEIGEYRTLLRLHRWGAGRKWCWRIRCSAAVNVVVLDLFVEMQVGAH